MLFKEDAQANSMDLLLLGYSRNANRKTKCVRVAAAPNVSELRLGAEGTSLFARDANAMCLKLSLSGPEGETRLKLQTGMVKPGK